MTELKGALHIDGSIDGVVETDFDISVGQKGSLTGIVKARSIYLSGNLEGKITCERLEILSTGKLIGELISGDLTIESGGKFVGQSREPNDEQDLAELKHKQGDAALAQLADSTKKLEQKKASADFKQEKVS